MKIYHYFIAIVASIALFACSNDDESAAPNEIKSVSVSLAGLNTKATGPTEIVTSQTKNVNSVLINLTDASGTVITSKTVTKDAILNSDWDKLTDDTKGLKFINISRSVAKVYVYGNPGTAVTNNAISTKLADQQGTAVLYYGVDEDLTPIVDEPSNPDPTTGKTYTANITIAPIIARLQITKISFKNSGSFVFTRMINNVQKSATVAWTGFTGSVKGIYLNSFYDQYSKPGTLSNLLNNTTFENHIQNGQWLFDTPATNATAYASYSNYANNAYADLPLTPAGQCYAFNFFPGTQIPHLHLDMANVVVTGLTSTDPEVYNPNLVFPYERFINIVKFYRDTNVEMTAADFKPGTLYNMEMELVPMLDNDLGNIQYNVLVHVTVAPWVEQTLIPGFNVDQ